MRRPLRPRAARAARRVPHPPRADPPRRDPAPALDDVAAAEEAALTAALSAAPKVEPAAPVSPPPPPTPSPAAAAAQAKLAAARAAAAAYKKAKDEGGDTGSVTAAAAAATPQPTHPPPSPQLFDRATPPPSSGALFDRSTPPPAATPSRRAEQGDADDQPALDLRPIGSNQGSETVAAGFLRGVVDAPSADDAALRPEEFTAKRVAAERARGAEVITAVPTRSDDADDPTSASYKPRVSTWGVFPRPDNISRAYGGGRTIRPGQALESEEDAAARKARQQAALKEYRKLVGLEIDPADEAAARAAVDEGKRLMDAGALEAAAAQFATAAKLMPARTLLGGTARLNQGICLDSLGKTDDAFALYKSVQSHPNAAVAKPVKRLMFGRTASDFLKADTINYRATKEETAPYFGRLRGDYDNTYAATDGENGARPADVAAALAVVGVPLLLAAALVAGK